MIARSTTLDDVPESIASSPEAARMSLAAAMTLGLRPGRFYRDAQLRCINLLQTYPEGCVGRCAYCGLARGRDLPAAKPEKGKSFIRVSWPSYSMETILDRMERWRGSYDRVCLSMVTHRGAVPDLAEMARMIRARLDVPISALLTPTLVDRAGLELIEAAGVDRIGIAVDAATPEIFDQLRGLSARGPHRWERYWEGLAEGAEVFGRFMAGCHLIVGLGETERQMVETFRRVRSIGCVTHLFSFFPEVGSAAADRPPPPLGQYRRMQLARYLIDGGHAQAPDMEFDEIGRLTSFGLDGEKLEELIASGEPFRTSGCPGSDGQVACNRPFANSRPGPDLRNYPFSLASDDVVKVRRELWE
jgi:biotin synthase